ncbi:hypothetical protein [Cellulomonas sp. URHD0024]|uniref:hypothetical protein n=1 Tax=Cellulomonas sp. URHD0024 TaxID=1302620 RepID=UPI0006885CA2|nr:hypothetical protein [Cellulomonas sp. URHD0024]
MTESPAPYPTVGTRLAPLSAVAVAVLSQVLMRDRIAVGGRFVVPMIELVLAITLIAVDGVVPAERRRAGIVRYALAITLCVSATSSAALMIADVLEVKPVSVQQMFAEGSQILVVLAVGFGLLFWQLDRGGPNGRILPEPELMSFWFTQDAIREYSDQFDSWQPRFLDYLYVGITNLVAFSPTDTMPLTRTAKALMTWESFVSIATFAVVLSRAVNVMK